MVNVWWCNQGTCWKGERGAGLVCSSSETTQLTYRKTVGDVRAGDIIVHYKKPYIVAISRAKEDGREGNVPGNVSCTYGWGWTFATDYYDLQTRIHRNAVNDAIAALAMSDSPVLANGYVRQAYLVPFDRRGLRIIMEAGNEAWPEWARACIGR